MYFKVRKVKSYPLPPKRKYDFNLTLNLFLRLIVVISRRRTEQSFNRICKFVSLLYMLSPSNFHLINTLIILKSQIKFKKKEKSLDLPKPTDIYKYEKNNSGLHLNLY